MAIYECRFEVVKTNHNVFSQKIYWGRCTALPKEGEQFVMYHGASRRLNTSTVQSITEIGTDEYSIMTLSGSRYHIRIGKEIKP